MSFVAPVEIEMSDISSHLNSFTLLAFLTGIYTVIYFGTIYVYFTRNSSKHYMVPAAITLLYLSGIIKTATQWYATKWRFIDNGGTRDLVFEAAFTGPRWTFTASDVLNSISFAIADGLLIWRCFHVWNRSVRIISLSLLLIVTEFALFLVYIILSDGIYLNSDTSSALGISLNDVLAAAYFISFGTTLVTTALIAYRIHSVSKFEGASSRRFKHVIDIVVQCGVVYALSQFVAAMAGVLPALYFIDNTSGVAFRQYTEVLNFSMAGISPTVMVARVALLSVNATFPSTSAHLSGLQFHAHSTNPTVNIEAVNITHSIDGDKISTGEHKITADKA